MDEKIDFGTIGVKIDDVIVFEPAKKNYKVGSGAGVPGNGGTFIQWKPGELWTIKCATRTLMGTGFKEESDLFSMWTFNGRTLRDLHEKNWFRNSRDCFISKEKKEGSPYDIAIMEPEAENEKNK